jgi:hypothetical protein
VISRLFYSWHHRFIYDEQTLGKTLERSGFQWVRCAVGQSEHAHLRGIEHHGELITAEINDLETMAVEANRT